MGFIRKRGLFFGCIVFFVFLCAGQAFAVSELNRQIDVLAEKLASANEGKVMQIDGKTIYVNLGQQQGIQPGNRFEIVRLGEALMDGSSIIGYKETIIATAKVVRSRKKMAVCLLEYLKQSSDNIKQVPEVGDKVYQLRKRINRLAVAQFNSNSGFNLLTKTIQEKLFNALSQRGLQVVERDQLEQVLNELKLGSTGWIDLKSAKKIGKLLGSEGIILGTVNDMGNTISISARLLDIENGQTITAADVELPKTPQLTTLLETPVEASSYGIQKSGIKIKKRTNKKAVEVKEFQGVTFALQGCKKSGETIRCDFFVTSKGKDRELRLRAPGRNYSKMYDNFNNVYDRNGNVQLANCSDRNLCRMILIANIPTRASITFGGVSGDAEFIALLQAHARVGNQRVNVTYRHVPFLR